MDKLTFCALVAAIAVAAIVAGGCREKKSAEPASAVPERIITLTPSATALVIAGGGLDRLVATDKFSDEPAAVAALPRVGDFLAPNVEAIAKLEPDLVIADAVQSKATESLRAIGVDVLSIEMHSVADVRRELVAVASRIGAAERGEAAGAALDRAIAAARDRARARGSAPRVLWVMDRQPGALSEIVAAGPGSFAAELLEITGARNAVTGSVRYPKLSREALIKIDPDVVIDASGAGGESMHLWKEAGWRAVHAPTDLATPGPEVIDAIGAIEGRVHGGG